MAEMCVRAEVSGEVYGLPVRYVTEVAETGSLTAVPGAPGHLLGVRNLRGSVVPVASLASLLGLAPSAAPERLVVCEHRAVRLGLAVDAVADVQELGEETSPSESPLLEATVLREGTLVGILDVPAVIAAAASGPAVA